MPNQCCCGDAPPPDCDACVSGTTPAQFSVTISGLNNSSCGFCTGLNGTYVVDKDDTADIVPFFGELCGWKGCFPVSISGGFCTDVDSILAEVAMYYDGTNSSIGVQLTLFSSADCSTGQIGFPFVWGLGTFTGIPDCDTINRTLSFNAYGAPRSECNHFGSTFTVTAL